MADETKKYSLDELHAEKLSEKYSAAISKFQTFDNDLKEFIRDDALKQQNLGFSVTYLFFERATEKLVGYITISNDAIRIEGRLEKEFDALIKSEGITYKYLPAVKIGRMCVDDRYTNRGLGKIMLDCVVYLILSKLCDFVGCRFITLEAKNYPRARQFYTKYGFTVLKERRKGTLPMFYDVFSAKDRIRQ